MIMAGCLNQAKRILQMYDSVLHGDTPEVLVHSTHQEIRDLLQTEECREFFNNQSQAGVTKIVRGTISLRKLSRQ